MTDIDALNADWYSDSDWQEDGTEVDRYCLTADIDDYDLYGELEEEDSSNNEYSNIDFGN